MSDAQYGNGGYNRQGGGYGQGSNPYAQQDDSYDHSGYNGGGYGRRKSTLLAMLDDRS